LYTLNRVHIMLYNDFSQDMSMHGFVDTVDFLKT
jgi:hypothetical protein